MAITVPPSSPAVNGNASTLVAQLSPGGTASLKRRDSVIDDQVMPPMHDSSQIDQSAAIVVHEELEGLIPNDVPRLRRVTEGLKQNDAPRLTTPRKETDENGHASVTVKLEKVDTSGHYKLHTDDGELRALLKQGLERSKDGEIKKKRSRFSDLVFTQQFTAFDRQNPASSTSIFHGFFALFW